jgi:hypothetical protein
VESVLNPDGQPLPTKIRFNKSFRLLLGNCITEIKTSDKAIGEQIANIYRFYLTDSADKAYLNIDILNSINHAGSYDLYINNRLSEPAIPTNGVAPRIVTAIFQATSESLNDKLLFHAALVRKNNKIILLPAESGSGKTTLTAGLVANGWEFLSDELAAIDLSTRTVIGIPFPLSIKPGAVELLSRYYPELGQQKTHHRPDGKKVKYLALQNPNSLNETNIDAIVFPKYNPASQTTLDTLDKTTALERLSKTGSSERPLTLEDVKAMVSIIEQTPCHELMISDLTQAVEMISGLHLA